jgi:hypothetical protein
MYLSTHNSVINLTAPETDFERTSFSMAGFLFVVGVLKTFLLQLHEDCFGDPSV